MATSFLLSDDGGGRVCQECTTLESDYVASLFSYSAYTDRRPPVRGDTLFLAAQTHDYRMVTLEFPRVPYRLFLSRADFGAIQQKGGIPDAEIRSCTRTVDSLGSVEQELIEVRLYSRSRYINVYNRLVEKKVPVAIDCAHDVLSGLDAVLNLGLPGACAALRLRRSAVKTVTESHWLVEAPARICAHGVSPRLPLLRNVVAVGWNADHTLSIGLSGSTERRVGVTEAKDILSRLRPAVVLVRDKDATLRQIGGRAPLLFSTLFSMLPCCPPERPSTSKPFRPGLGVLVFDVATAPGLSPDVPLCQWVDAYFSQRWLEHRWKGAVTLRTAMRDNLGAYEAFTAAMVLHYGSTRTVCELTPKARAPYQGGHTIPPQPAYLLEQPVAEFDFVSMYPTLARISNAGKNTFVPQGGQWDIGEEGGFTTDRHGCLADALKERLEERLRIVHDPAMETRARYLKQTINAMVGMSGHKLNPYSDTRVAGCITAMGRRLLKACHRKVREITLGGYTDSLFLKLPRSPSNKDPLQTWMSRSVVAEYEARFKKVIQDELESMAPTLQRDNGLSLRFECKRVATVGLFTRAAYSYAAGYLIFENGDPLVDVQVKGYLKSATWECVRLFQEALVSISIAGEFLLADQKASRLGDIRAIAEAVPIRVMTNSGWKSAVSVTMSSEPHGSTKAIVRYADDTESHHWFLPQARVDRLVEVTNVVRVDDARSCADRRRLSAIAIAETFYRQLCQGRLPPSAYVTDKMGRVVVRLDDGQSKTIPLSEAARNGLRLDLDKYAKRWIEKCIDKLTCGFCHLPLSEPGECRYVPGEGDAGPILLHESCGPAGAFSLDDITPSFLSAHIKTALSAILVAGANHALEAVARLISLCRVIEEIPVREENPLRSYEETLAQLKATVADGTTSKEYVDGRRAFCCIPDGQDAWFCLPSVPTSMTALGLLHQATRILARRRRYAGDDVVLKAISAYPAHRLRVAPPPVLMADGTAPTSEWQEIMSMLAVSATSPKFITSTPFRCPACNTVFDLDIGACGHLACKTCSINWKTCITCKVEWHGLTLTRNTQMNYHPSVFPFGEWYEEPTTTKWRVYRGPDDLIYDSSARHIMALARGEVCG